jgi:transcriptional regulator with XRE-family HTH domain
MTQPEAARFGGRFISPRHSRHGGGLGRGNREVSVPSHTDRVPAVERRRDRADRVAARLLAELGREIRIARHSSGLSQVSVGAAAGVAQARISRLERARAPAVPLQTLCRVLDAVGLEPSFRAFPAGQPIRDAGHLRVIARLRTLVSPRFTWTHEVPLPNPGDLRAWDILLRIGATRIGIEVETRPRDVQALQRRLALKKRDGGVDRLVLVLADTRWNRLLLLSHSAELEATFPADRTNAIAALREGRDPEADALVLI